MIRFIWALPVTLFGLLLVGVGLLTGGRVHQVDVVVEQDRGLVGWILFRLGHACITFGYVTLGVNPGFLDFYRDHERVHTRQYGRWGIFLWPAYLASSVWEFAHGRDPWRDNWFERQAITEAGL